VTGTPFGPAFLDARRRAGARDHVSMARWNSFKAHGDRGLAEAGNPHHRARVEYSEKTILVHLSDEDGPGWTCLAVDRETRRCAVSQARRQMDAASDAYERLYGA
jgi:hypothetical protein